MVDAIADEYRKKGIQFLGLETSAAGDAGALRPMGVHPRLHVLHLVRSDSTDLTAA